MKLTKALAATAAVLALVIVVAAPASATPHYLTVTGGTLTNPVLGSFNFAGTQPCTNLAIDSDTILIDEAGTGTPTTTTVTAVNVTTSLTSGAPATPYMVNITLHTGQVTGSITSTGVVATNLSLKVTFTRAVNTSGTCVSDNGPTRPPALVCTVRLDFNTTITGATQLTGTASTHPLTQGATLTLSGLGIFGTALATCGAPFATVLTGGSDVATVGSLALHRYA